MFALVAQRYLFVEERYALALAPGCKPRQLRRGALHAPIGPASVAHSLFGKLLMENLSVLARLT